MRQRTYGGVGSPAREGGLTRLRLEWSEFGTASQLLTQLENHEYATVVMMNVDRLSLN